MNIRLKVFYPSFVIIINLFIVTNGKYKPKYIHDLKSVYTCFFGGNYE